MTVIIGMRRNARDLVRWIGLGLGAMVATAMLMTGCSSSYDNPQAWCSISSVTGSTQCFYSTQEQCLATISGIGGICEPNPDYTGTTSRPRRALQRPQ